MRRLPGGVQGESNRSRAAAECARGSGFVVIPDGAGEQNEG